VLQKPKREKREMYYEERKKLIKKEREPKNKDKRWDYEYDEYDEYDGYDGYERYDEYDYNDTSEDDW
jgi:hypothetical protein